MKKFLLWFLAFLITISAAVYQRMTGPTYPKRINISVNKGVQQLHLVRSLSLNEKPEVKIDLADPNIKAKLFFKRYKTEGDYQVADFSFRADPKHPGFFADVPRQPAAGKIQYYIEITDSDGTQTYLKESPVVIRFKGDVPASVLVPHILLMFLAMLFSTLAGLMAAIKYPLYKKYAIWTLILFIAGGMVLGPIVQYDAFGDFWTGIPFGWDLTDNKTLIALLFWILAVVMNRKKERPVYTVLAAIVLLLVFSIPHSLFGSELNYSGGQVTQGIILNIF
ncbi:MAG TPA: hypothetical protein VF346_03210 [Bacteroidales bacterium]